MEMLQEEHRHLLDKIAQNEGFQKYDIEFQDTQKEGFLSNIFLVTIKDDTSSKRLDLIMKVNQEKNFQNLKIDTLYKKEIYIYETVFRKFDEFIKESGSDMSIGVPKYLGSWGHSCIVLENLKVKEYRLWNKQVPMDRNHLIEGLKEFARFHSVSLAMKTKQPEVFQSLVLDGFKPFASTPENLKQLVKACVKAGAELAGDDEESKEVLDEMEAIGEEFILKTMADEKYHLVLAHGDCWCNNILYKYKDVTMTPVDAMLVDFQIAKPGSPIRDVAYFLFVNSSKEDLQIYKDYLKIYYEELSSYLQQLSCEIKYCFSQDTFEDHWKAIAKYGLYISMLILKLTGLGKENAVSKDFYEQFQMSLDSLEFKVVRQRIIDLLRFAKQECIV
ncbi:unnamed protein product [Acanthoscelides obtectus]|uniref:CHK kinase-like domain-containing protein n=2 Tax=Acanthoscelides obtectus TaxID=200917 RepID=A0A9P0VNJ4_ACAOB|nr:unnamed protein product [Acanthoscelides obtectus]CAK1622160.1 hypothetical protein AOBTE_LOCUS1343 [Acanthoscelides obtectus]